MRLYFLAILLSSRVVNSGPLNFDDSTLSELDDFSALDGGNAADTGQVMELPLESSQPIQVDSFSNNRANSLPDYQIPHSTNDASPNLLASLPVAGCLGGDSQAKGSATKNGDSCPALLNTSPSGQPTEEGRQQQQEQQQQDSGEKKDDQPIVNTKPPDNICTPPKRLFCCFGREVKDWNSREGCEEFTTLEECHRLGGFPFCCLVSVGVINSGQLVMVKMGIGCDKDPVTADKFPPSDNIIQFPTFPANVIPFLRTQPRRPRPRDPKDPA